MTVFHDLAVSFGGIAAGAADLPGVAAGRPASSGHDLAAGQEARGMRCLVVFCHPSETSFGAAILETARTAIRGAGHELRVIDLYRERFDPVLSTEEWHSYLADTARNIAAVRDHVDAMQWAESLVLIFPQWMYGPPARLKGWLERVWLPGVAFEIPSGRRKRATGLFHNIRRVTVVTTSGSPWWWLFLIRDPCRNMFRRGFRVLFHRRCRIRWLQLHDINHSTEIHRKEFLDRVRRALAAPHGGVST